MAGMQVTTENASRSLSRCGERRTLEACRRKKSRSFRRDWNQKNSNGAIWHERAAWFSGNGEPAPEISVRIVDRFHSDSILHRRHVVADGTGLVELSQDLRQHFSVAGISFARILLLLPDGPRSSPSPSIVSHF